MLNVMLPCMEIPEAYASLISNFLSARSNKSTKVIISNCLDNVNKTGVRAK